MGTEHEELMKKFGFKTSNQLKVAYTNALIALGKIPAPKKGRPKKPVSKTVTVNDRGSLVIPKKLVEALELNPGDLFKVENVQTGLFLSPVEKPPKTILKKKRSNAPE
ncbi:MAG: AbrB/MazE/SpoVT family DNA-binding domain-containing protein [Desulfobacterales bacterium]|nr:AbrB/MazE/SpoVT family DNA-binding domain-containing protein [Desulfobacterales bacterium]